MAKFFKKPRIIEATQWFKNGDHPKDRFSPEGVIQNGLEGLVVRYFRTPDVDGSEVCSNCNKPMHIHGYLEHIIGGYTVCPGDWIITNENGDYYPIKPHIFKDEYELVYEH